MGFPKFLKIAVKGIKNQVQNDGTIAKEVTPFEFDVKLTETIASALKFSYDIAIPRDGEYGRPLENGSWTGMLGMLQREEADMVISNLAATEERINAFPCSYPFYSAEITYMTRKHEYSPSKVVFLHPFSIEVWTSMVICISIMPFIFKTLTREKYSIPTLFTSTIAALLGQGMPFQPQKWREYLLIVTWLFGSMCLSYFYSAVLLSFLTFPSLSGIRSIKDLADGITDGSYHCTTFPGSIFAPYLIRSKDPSMEIIGKDLLRTSSEGTRDFVSVMENAAGEKKPAFIGVRDYFFLYTDFYFVSEETFFTAFGAIFMRKGVCCKSELDKVLVRLQASGISEKIASDARFRIFLRDFYRKAGHTYRDDEKERKLTLAVFEGPFLFLIVSHSLAVLLLLIEIYIHKFKLF